jgi:hypothetical protein
VFGDRVSGVPLRIKQPVSGKTCACQTNTRSPCDRSTRPAATYAGIVDDLEFIKTQLARLPTRKELAGLTLLATLTTAALVLAGIETLQR